MKRIYYVNANYLYNNVLTIHNGKIIEGTIMSTHFRLVDGEYELDKYVFSHNGTEIELPAGQRFYRDIQSLNDDNCINFSTSLDIPRGYYFNGCSAETYVFAEHVQRFHYDQKGLVVDEGFLPSQVYKTEEDALAYNTQTIHKDDGTVETVDGPLRCLLLTEEQKRAAERFDEAFTALNEAGVGIIMTGGRSYFINKEKVRNLGYYDEYETKFSETKELESKLEIIINDYDGVTLEL